MTANCYNNDMSNTRYFSGEMIKSLSQSEVSSILGRIVAMKIDTKSLCQIFQEKVEGDDYKQFLLQYTNLLEDAIEQIEELFNEVYDELDLAIKYNGIYPIIVNSEKSVSWIDLSKVKFENTLNISVLDMAKLIQGKIPIHPIELEKVSEDHYKVAYGDIYCMAFLLNNLDKIPAYLV